MAIYPGGGGGGGTDLVCFCKAIGCLFSDDAGM